MNIGARGDNPAEYDASKMKQNVDPKALDSPHKQNTILRQLSDAFNWIEQRGNSGDNIPENELNEFHRAILDKNLTRAMTHACNILETKMHPTARDIVTKPVKQSIYTITGSRAYTYRIE